MGTATADLFASEAGNERAGQWRQRCGQQQVL